MSMTPQDLQRLENKVDKLTDAVTHLVRIDERQVAHTGRLAALEVRVEAGEKAQVIGDKLLNSWINRGIGAWAFAGTAFGAFKYFVN